ncbi:MAG: hypothetical protein ACRDPH_01655 [Marmoricola sp.]
MSPLERRYRRLLALYPRAFRRDHERELLDVLMTGARPGQRRPELGETAALVRSSVWMHLRPAGRGSSPPAVSWAVRLMCVAALLELLAALLVTLTSADVHAAIAHSDLQLTAAGWRHIVATSIRPVQIGAPIVAAAWLLSARASGRGRDWGRIVTALLAALNLFSLVNALAQRGFALAPVDAAIGCALCAVGVAAVVLSFSPGAASHYARRLAPD